MLQPGLSTQQILHNTLHTLSNTLHNAYWTLYTIHCTLCTAKCTPYTIYLKLYNTHRRMIIVFYTCGRNWQSSWYSCNEPRIPSFLIGKSSQHRADVSTPMAFLMTKGPVAPSNSSQKLSSPTLGNLSSCSNVSIDHI